MGSEVAGIDLATASREQAAEVQQVLNERMVLVFRDQELPRDQHKRLGTLFGTGELHRHRLAGARGADPEVLVVKTNEKSKYTAGNGWHTDVSCDPNPIVTSMLYVTEVPKCGGGDTVFVNMNAAYESLSEPIQKMICELKAVHDGALPWKIGYGIDPGPDNPYPRTAHPVVLEHPETGKKLLYVNRGFTSHIKGLSRFESRHLLEMLFCHIESNPRFQCRVKWQPNTLVMWDNLATQHHASWDYFPETRYGERVSSVGPVLAGVS